jgi:PDZ domain
MNGVEFVGSEPKDQIRSWPVTNWRRSRKESIDWWQSSRQATLDSDVRACYIPLPHAINATLQRFDANRDERWMFQDVDQGDPAYAAGIRPGDLLLACGGREIRSRTTAARGG